MQLQLKTNELNRRNIAKCSCGEANVLCKLVLFRSRARTLNDVDPSSEMRVRNATKLVSVPETLELYYGRSEPMSKLVTSDGSLPLNTNTLVQLLLI